MITPAFNLTATERVLPRLALDFTTALLDGRVTFVRTTSASNPATYTGSDGYIALATNDQPRFDYDSITLACKGLLIEESRTNLLSYSNTFSDISWNKPNTVLSASAEISPDGTTNATKLSIAAATAVTSINKNSTVVAGTSYTITVYAKADELLLLNLGFAYNTNEYSGTQFNLSTGTVVRTWAAGTGNTATNATITLIKNQWYRCTVTITSGRTTAFPCVLPSNSTWSFGAINQTLTGNGTDGVHIWQAQFEAGAFPTSVIPTTTTAVTRNADVASMTGTNFSDWYNPTEGTLYQEYSSATTSGVYASSLGTFSNGIFFRPIFGQNMFVRKGNVTQAQLGNVSFTPNTFAKQIGAYALNDIASCVNASVVATDALAELPDVSAFYLGGVGAGVYGSFYFKKLSYYPLRLSNANLQALTN